MYYFQNALVKRNGKNSRWEQTDISTMTMTAIFEAFQEAYIGIYQPSYPVCYVLLSVLRLGQVNYNINYAATLYDWLMTVPGYIVFPSVTTALPTITKKTVRYSDAWRAGYNATLALPVTYSPQSQQPLGLYTDLIVSRDSTDYPTLASNCLFTVNGLVHASQLVPSIGVRVVDGGRTGQVADNNHLGIISFREIGTITQIPITTAMFANPSDAMLYGNELYLNLGIDLTNRSVIVCLGGYLHINDSVYDVVGPETGLIKLSLRNILWPNRIFESQRIIDLSSVPFTRHPHDQYAFQVTDLQSNAVMSAYVTLSQSFVIVVDTPNLILDRTKVESMQLPGRYQTYSEPTLPMALSSGILPEYMVRLEDGIWVLSVQKNLKPNYQYATTDWQNNTYVIENLIPWEPYNWAVAEFLELSQQTVVVV